MDAPPEAPTQRATGWSRARPLIFLSVIVPQTIVLLVQGVAPVLLRDAPLLLLAMHPFEPWALLVSPKVGFMAFVVIIVVVRASWYCGDYFLGRWYGERGLQWLKQRRATGRTTAWVERLFPRLGGFLLILYPGVIVSVLAGATGMRFRRFAALILLGLLLWGSLLRLIATAAAEPLTDVAQYVERHAWWLVIPLGVVSVVMIVRESRRRATPQR